MNNSQCTCQQRNEPDPTQWAGDNVEQLQKMAQALPKDLESLVEPLRELRQFAHNFQYSTDQKLREAAAEAKVNKMVEAGISFRTVEIDKVYFFIDRSGTLRKQQPDEIPF